MILEGAACSTGMDDTNKPTKFALVMPKVPGFGEDPPCMMVFRTVDDMARYHDAIARQAKPPEEYLTVQQYADRWQVSVRTIESRITSGLPLVGEGKMRRVPVQQADAWLSQQRDRVIDMARQKAAMVSARRAA